MKNSGGSKKFNEKILLKTKLFEGKGFALAPDPARPQKEALTSPFQLVSAPVPKTGRTSNIGRVIKRLRREKNLSQGHLARKASVSRSLIARIESGQMGVLPIPPLEQIARALGMDLPRIFVQAEALNDALVYSGEVSRIEFTLDFPEEGFRIQSPFPVKKEFFFGKILIQPQRSVLRKQLPQTEVVFIHGEVGRIVLICDAKEHLIKPGECLTLSGLKDYELYNTDPLKESSILFITSPSILTF